MSWQEYVDTSLVGTHHVHHGCIISAAGDSIWAHSAGFKPTNPEMKFIADLLKEAAGALDKAYSQGVTFAGKPYVLAKKEGRSVYLRSRKDEAGNGGKEGLAIAQTKQAIIIAYHNEDQVFGNAVIVVEALADYLIGLQY